MSALPLKADIWRAIAKRLLMTQSGHFLVFGLALIWRTEADRLPMRAHGLEQRALLQFLSVQNVKGLVFSSDNALLP